MDNFLYTLPQHIQDSLHQEAMEEMFDQWLTAHDNEETIYFEHRLLSLTTDEDVKNQFNEYYELKAGEMYYL